MNTAAMSTGPAPWLLGPWQTLLERAAAGRLPGGLLVTGAEGTGKGWLVTAFLQRLYCDRASGLQPACGDCGGCRSLAGGVHPEVHEVMPPEPGKEIPVDAIRTASEFLGLSGSATWRVLRLHPAEAMNASAANALLKTLEEPPSGALAILESARPSALPATIRSRCQNLHLATPSLDQARAWLAGMTDDPGAVEAAWAAALGRPMTAAELLADPDRQAAWERDRDALTGLLRATDLHSVVPALMRCDPETLVPRLQALLLSAQRWLASGEMDRFGAQFPREDLQRFARERGARGMASLVQQSRQWQRQLRTTLNPQLRMEDMAAAMLPLTTPQRVAYGDRSGAY